ncbi:unnamed protein product [Paramecium pentaurelia]|uniref:Uncharacterized protein n=1 Tax=Paramecium pentaurelia TaxID=43138 RepID=A0A8S1Y975_9CILI|nr:unnamed protein product [Paramecium pentaurelia]
MSLQDKQTFEQILAEYMGKLYYTSFILQSDIGKNVFIKNGEIIRMQLLDDIIKRTQYLKHLQQIQHLKWRKNESEDLENEVWSVIWNGYQLYAGGALNINGAKVGKWIELFEHFLEKSQIFYLGNYQDGIKTGKWISQFQDTSIGGGFYKENGQKDGRWTDIDHYFRDCYLITYGGRYDNGTKVGIWMVVDNTIQVDQKLENGENYMNIYWRITKFLSKESIRMGSEEDFSKLSQIMILCNLRYDKKSGGGEYNQNGLKIGYWIELDQCFNMQGLYKESIKNGIWKLQYQLKNMGGGFFDQNGGKNGFWIEIGQNFYHGEYINNIKRGQWNALLNNKLIGGGRYYENQEKVGKWIELYENYWDEAQILFTGDYLIGQKTGIWMTIFEDKIIGGGCYANNGMKHGKWIDLYHNFWEFCQITFQGSYINGIKTGIWNSYFENNIIGGGYYDENGLKQGQWIELHDNFDNNTQIKINGNYQNGRKSGSWEFINKSKIIGGGLYDENGFKHGKWTELDDDFNLSLVDPCKITYSGEYKRGQKQGKFVAVEIY